MGLHSDRLSIQTESPQYWLNLRHGESKIGEHIAYFNGDMAVAEQLRRWRLQGLRYVLIGIPEDIGPRANCGRGGADLGWSALMQSLLNLQWHPQASINKVGLLGQIELSDLLAQAIVLDANKPQQLVELRQLVEQIDQRVQPALTAIFAAGLIPIVVGGGHNNALPILRAYHQAKGQQATVINLDPHADTRPLEGRHSGNPFSYALHESLLGRYAVVGLNRYRNSQQTLAVFEQENCQAFDCSLSLTDGAVSEAIADALAWLNPNQELGVELDLDAIAMMPSSAMSPWGLSLGQAQHYLDAVTQHSQLAWLHLAEGAPDCHSGDKASGMRQVGDALAALLLTALAAGNDNDNGVT